jgi:hypothetical protein
MKCAVLCNGPSRSAYSPETEYAFRIGCNIPWTKVDCTVVLDPQMVKVLIEDTLLIDCGIYFSQAAWDYIEEVKASSLFNSLGIIQKTRKGLSSGNLACMKAVELGYTDIDIYGADAMTTNDIRSNNVSKSYTRNFLYSDSMNMSPDWRTNFNKMIQNHPEVKFNFIKGNGNVKDL